MQTAAYAALVSKRFLTFFDSPLDGCNDNG
jgi:hypothetical protein